MRKIWSQLGLDPWEWEINLLIEQGTEEYKAKSLVIMSWMKAGDARPLLWAIKKNGMLRGPVLGLLAQMLESGELTFRKGRGRRRDPEAAARDKWIADTYDDFKKYYQIDDGELVDTLGSATGVSEESARRALTNKRKSKSSGST
jgi:hypothetical protein